jgi:hypothetical protein
VLVGNLPLPGLIDPARVRQAIDVVDDVRKDHRCNLSLRRLAAGDSAPRIAYAGLAAPPASQRDGTPRVRRARVTAQRRGMRPAAAISMENMTCDSP